MKSNLALMTIISTLALAGSVHAQASNQEAPVPQEQGGKQRELGKHRFVMPSEFDNAFVGTSLAFDQGFGQLSVKSADGDGKLFLLRERFRLAVGLGDRIALVGSADARAGVAGDEDTLLALAGVANLEFRVGAKARLVTLDEAGLQLSFGLNFRPTMTYAVTPSQAFATGSTKQLLQKQSVSYVEPGLMVAWGGGPLGVQVALAPSVTTNSSKGESELFAGAGVTLDFGNPSLSHVPIALDVEYNLDKTFDGTSPQHFVTSGIFYSGKRDLQLGLRYSVIAGKADERLQFGMLCLGYFF